MTERGIQLKNPKASVYTKRIKRAKAVHKEEQLKVKKITPQKPKTFESATTPEKTPAPMPRRRKYKQSAQEEVKRTLDKENTF